MSRWLTGLAFLLMALLLLWSIFFIDKANATTDLCGAESCPVSDDSFRSWRWEPEEVIEPSGQSSTVYVYRGMGSQAEKWRGLAANYFHTDDLNRVVCLIAHESGGNPNARNPYSGAAGLMQVMPFWAGEFGFAVSDLYDPNINLLLAHKIRGVQGWTAWSPIKRGQC